MLVTIFDLRNQSEQSGKPGGVDPTKLFLSIFFSSALD